MNTSEQDDAKALPLDSWHRSMGARMVPFAGYAMPIQYEGIMAEHLWTRSSAGLFDVSHMGQLIVSGDGAEAALEALMPADLSILGDGKMRYSLLLDQGGGILDDLMITRCPTGFSIVVNGAVKADDIAHMCAHLPTGVTLDHLEDRALLALQGPKAAEILGRLTAGAKHLCFMEAAICLWGEVPLWISRSGYTGEDGFEISVQADQVEALATALCDQPEVRPIGLGARDSLRLEAGLPLYGHDLDTTTTPVMADLGFALSKRRREEGGFPGAEHVAMQRRDGPIQKRVGLLVEGRQPVREGSLVLDAEGNAVGRVTSGGFSPSLERPIAMAYVPLASAAPGSNVTIEQRGKLFSGVVTAMPFVPHRYHRRGASQ